MLAAATAALAGAAGCCGDEEDRPPPRRAGQPGGQTSRRSLDTMGLIVVGRRRFLGSGHPDLRDDLPPFLGLIDSRDAGRSWRAVSRRARTTTWLNVAESLDAPGASGSGVAPLPLDIRHMCLVFYARHHCLS